MSRPPGAPRPPRPTRDAFRAFRAIGTRWMDNDVYGHVNNVQYYSFIDTAVNRLLVEGGWLDVARGPVIGLVVETTCRYHAPISFPDLVTVGIRLGHRGRTSVRYEVGLFRNDEDLAAADGHFVHVYVERATSRPVSLPDGLGAILDGITG